MTIEDEARAYINRKHPEWHDNGVGIVQGSHYRAGFVAGAEWQASRKVEAAPSELWPEAGGGCTCWVNPKPFTHYGAVEPGDALEPNPDCPKHFPEAAPSDTDREALLTRADRVSGALEEYEFEGLAGDAAATMNALIELARTHQPVQVEVTSDMVESATGAALDAVQPTWRATGSTPSADDLTFVRAALTAALGGGEHE